MWWRPLIVLTLVAAVFAMHALTVGHPATPVGSVSSSSASPVSGMHVAEHGGSGEDPPPPPADGHWLELCVAVLLAGAVVWLVVARRSPLGRALRPLEGRRVTTPAASRPPPSPSLTRLCVLRT